VGNSLEQCSPGKCLNLPCSLSSKESSNHTEKSCFPVLSKKPYCRGSHCCSALSLPLTYTLRASQRGWDLGVSSHPGFAGRWQLSLLERHQKTRMGPRNWLVICFSISALLLNLLPLLIKTNTHSLTSRCYCWLTSICPPQQMQPGRAGAFCRLGRKEVFYPGQRALLLLFIPGAGLSHMWLRRSLWSSNDLWICSSTVPSPGAFPSGSCYSRKSLLPV